MALFASFMRLRGKTWHYRRRVPTDLREFFDNLHEFTKTCKSNKQGEARTLRAFYDTEIDRICLALRVNVLTPAEARKKVDDLLNTRKFAEPPKKEGYHSPAVPSILTLADVVRSYELQHSIGWTSKTTMEKAGIFRRIKNRFGNQPINAIRPDDVLYWRKELVAEQYGVVTINKYLSNLSGIMKHAVKHGHISLNPVEGTALVDERHDSEIRAAYSIEDLQLIFVELQKEKTSAYAANKAERYWAPLLCMYTGLRADECAQLYLEDVNTNDLTVKVERSYDKKVKNKSSIRTVPIHPDLLTLGFLVYTRKMLDQGHSRLFPSLSKHPQNGYSHELVKWWSRWSRKYITDKKKTFHSFRHTVADRLKQSDVDGVLIAEILGHEVKSISLGRYGKYYSIEKKLSALFNLNYGVVPGLEIDEARVIDDETGLVEDEDTYAYYVRVGAKEIRFESKAGLDQPTKGYTRPDLHGYSLFHTEISHFVED